MLPNKKYLVCFLPLRDGEYWPDIIDEKTMPKVTEALFTSSLAEAFKKFNDLSQGPVDTVSLDRLYPKEQEYSEILRYMRGGVFEGNLLKHGDTTYRLLKGYWRVDIFPHWADADRKGPQLEDWVGRGGDAYAHCRTKADLQRFTDELRKLPRSYDIYQPRNRRRRSHSPIYRWDAWTSARQNSSVGNATQIMGLMGP